MKISTKGRYALRALMYLAQNEKRKKPITISEISKDQGISVKYLELIVRMLVSLKMVKSIKGKNGGLVLAKKANKIRFLDILKATEGSLSLVACVDNPKTCGRHKICYARNIWIDFSEIFANRFRRVTLRQLVNKYCGKNPRKAKSSR